MTEKKSSKNNKDKKAKTKIEMLHTSLDIADDAPSKAGKIADGLNAVVYLVEGDVKNAVEKGLSSIPVCGKISKTKSKTVKKFDKTSDKAENLMKADKEKDAREILIETVQIVSKVTEAVRDAAQIAETVKTTLNSIKIARQAEKGANATEKLKDIAIAGKMKTGAKAVECRRDRKKTFESKKKKDKSKQLQEVIDEDVVPKGLERARTHGAGWKWASLKEAIKKFTPNAKPRDTPTGKTIYENPETGRNVVYDKSGRYFRIEDSRRKGDKRYLDENGNDIGKGMEKKLYQQATHFNNLDERQEIIKERSKNKEL